MKAYIVRIEIEESNPLIWRRIIMPAGATYRRLHDIIQNVTNFQSGYPGGGYHLYEFNLPKENRIVTDNEEAYMEHQHYIKNKKYYAERLKSMPANMLQFEKDYQERLKIEVRKPNRLKMDDYLERYKEIRYNYDLGYPTLLDGAEAAPPEDVGGIHGFYEFLEAYRDPKHPEHSEMKAWAQDWNFREYDPDWINERLKDLDYKKTEWDKINHEHYKVIKDKYTLPTL